MQVHQIPMQVHQIPMQVQCKCNIYSSDDVDELIANQFIVEYDALEKRIEAFVMQSIKENINITNNEI